MVYDREIIARVVFEADHVIQTECTIRELADYTAEQSKDGKGISKSTAHNDMAVILPEVNWNKYLKVREIFNKHRDESSYKGGEANRRKWQQIKKQSS